MLDYGRAMSTSANQAGLARGASLPAAGHMPCPRHSVSPATGDETRRVDALRTAPAAATRNAAVATRCPGCHRVSALARTAEVAGCEAQIHWRNWKNETELRDEVRYRHALRCTACGFETVSAPYRKEYRR